MASRPKAQVERFEELVAAAQDILWSLNRGQPERERAEERLELALEDVKFELAVDPPSAAS